MYAFDKVWGAIKVAATSTVAPFGAVVTRGQEICRVCDGDEVAEALATKGDMTGCIVYLSCEPNLERLNILLRANVERLYYAASKKDAVALGLREYEKAPASSTWSIPTNEEFFNHLAQKDARQMMQKWCEEHPTDASRHYKWRAFVKEEAKNSCFEKYAATMIRDDEVVVKAVGVNAINEVLSMSVMGVLYLSWEPSECELHRIQMEKITCVTPRSIYVL